MNDNCARLSALALGFSLAISWSLGVLLLGLMAWMFHWGNDMVTFLAKLYIGYDATFLGATIGAGYALIDGFICGFLIAFFYNLCLKCCCKKCK